MYITLDVHTAFLFIYQDIAEELANKIGGIVETLQLQVMNSSTNGY